jgi:hypothetical protein
MSAKPAGRRRRWSVRVWGLVTVLLCSSVLASGAIGYWQLEAGRGPATASRPGNGIPFAAARADLNATLLSQPGGPWRLDEVLGIAAQALSGPLPAWSGMGANQSLNGTMAQCGELGGMTEWNSSGIPTFTGDLNSGAAPFWSFVFGNDSGSYLYGTVILGTPRLYPSGVSTLCVDSAGLDPSVSANQSLLNIATSSLAESAYRATGEQFVTANSPVVEYLEFGIPQIAELDWGPAWAVDYSRCGLDGVSGVQNYSSDTIQISGNGLVASGTITCSNSRYVLGFDGPPLNSTPAGSNGTYLALPFQVEFPNFPPPNGTYYDGWGLEAWMFELNLAVSGGLRLEESSASCQRWVSSLAGCLPATAGWFAVLLGQDGQWLDSYPSDSTPTGWAIPNVLVTSHDQLVLVAPGSWTPSGVSLAVSGVTGGPIVSGASAL